MGEPKYYDIALISLFLYSALCGCSLLQYFHHRNLCIHGIGGKYISMKMKFFMILAVSSLLDIPVYFGCLYYDGPKDCEWDTISYPILWIFHLIAVCGYGLILTIPPLLWEDIIHRREGKFLFEEWPRDTPRKVFLFCLVLYFCTALYCFVCIILFYDVSDHESFYNNSDVSMISQFEILLEALVIFLLASACLFYGFKLQRHVINTGISSEIQRKLIIQLNFVLFVVVICYLARALLIIRLFARTPDPYKHSTKVSYFTWTLATRWLPHVFCSFCLLRVMSRNSAASNINNVKSHWRHSSSNHPDIFLKQENGMLYSHDNYNQLSTEDSSEEFSHNLSSGRNTACSGYGNDLQSGLLFHSESDERDFDEFDDLQNQKPVNIIQSSSFSALFSKMLWGDKSDRLYSDDPQPAEPILATTPSSHAWGITRSQPNSIFEKPSSSQNSNASQDFAFSGSLDTARTSNITRPIPGGIVSPATSIATSPTGISSNRNYMLSTDSLIE